MLRVPDQRQDLAEEVLERAQRETVKFVNLQFTDILGVVKSAPFQMRASVETPARAVGTSAQAQPQAAPAARVN